MYHRTRNCFHLCCWYHSGNRLDLLRLRCNDYCQAISVIFTSLTIHRVVKLSHVVIDQLDG